MRVRMTRDLDISLDGRTPQKLKTGESYNIPESLVPNLLDKGIAIEDKALDPPKETKTKIKTKKTTGRRPRK